MLGMKTVLILVSTHLCFQVSSRRQQVDHLYGWSYQFRGKTHSPLLKSQDDSIPNVGEQGLVRLGPSLPTTRSTFYGS